MQDKISRFRGDYFFLSNFFLCRIEWRFSNGMVLTFHSSEALYQALKSDDPAVWERFSKILSPGLARKEGRLVTLRPNWKNESICDMAKTVKAKYIQNPRLIRKLLGTGNRYLEEGNNHGDVFWGTCNGKGQNWLGRIHMDLRTEFRQEVNSGNILL